MTWKAKNKPNQIIFINNKKSVLEMLGNYTKQQNYQKEIEKRILCLIETLLKR